MKRFLLVLLLISFTSAFSEPFKGNLKDPKDLYECIGVKQTASTAEIKAAIELGLAKYDPTKNVGDKEARLNYTTLTKIKGFFVTDTGRLRTIYSKYFEIAEKAGKHLPFTRQMNIMFDLHIRSHSKWVTFDDFKAINEDLKAAEAKMVELDKLAEDIRTSLKEYAKKKSATTKPEVKLVVVPEPEPILLTKETVATVTPAKPRWRCLSWAEKLESAKPYLVTAASVGGVGVGAYLLWPENQKSTPQSNSVTGPSSTPVEGELKPLDAPEDAATKWNKMTKKSSDGKNK